MFPLETEPNDTQSLANALPAAGVMQGAINTVNAIAPDVDDFFIDVQSPNQILQADITDFGQACPTGANTVLTLYGPNGAAMVSNHNGAANGCSGLKATFVPALVNLAPGRYTLEVRSFSAAVAVPFYVLRVTLQATGCANGIKEPAEECDDGNSAAGDGCSSTCTLEANFTPETEPNEIFSTGTSLRAGSVGWLGDHATAADVDYLIFSLAAPANVSWQTGSGVGECSTWVSTVLYGSGGAAVASSTGACGLASAAATPNLQLLPAGTYGLRVAPLLTTRPSWAVRLNVDPPVCGDNVSQTPEDCDDGALVNGDGCSSLCAFEVSIPGEVEPNGTAAAATPMGARIKGNFVETAPALDFFSLNVPSAGMVLSLQLSNGLGGCTAGTKGLVVYAADQTTLLASASGVGCTSLAGGVAHPELGNLPVGNVYVRVSPVGNLVSTYVLSAAFAAPACGDGVLQAGEHCDDGNTISGDGCSSTCNYEFPFETEPNGSTSASNGRSQAQAILTGSSPYRVAGGIRPAGDNDWFILTLTQTSSVKIKTSSLNGVGCPGDTVVRLWGASGNSAMAANDDDPTGTNGVCSLIDGVGDAVTFPRAANMPAGRYYVQVSGWDSLCTATDAFGICTGPGDQLIDNYLLTVTVQ